MRTHCSFSILLICLTLPVFSQGTPQAQQIFPRASVPIPENDEARRELEDLFYVPNSALLKTEDRILGQRSAGTTVNFQMQRQGGYIYYLFLNEERSAYSVAGVGNYIIKRDLESGRFVQIKVFLRSHPGCFVRLFPLENRTSMDVYLFGIAVDRGVLLPLEFQSFLTEPFAKVMTLTKATVQWERLLYRREGGNDTLTAAHINQIQRILPSLSDRDDGAMDADCKFVYIESGLPQEGLGGLNCSGFAKWISDGFYFPLAGKYLEIEALKEKHLEYRGNRWSLRFEEGRDPYFGLDWSRNLATALWGAQGYPTESPEDFDVRQVDYLGYREDVGFPLEELELMLFLEASANPGHFYIGSLNREYGGQPVLRQHFHLAVLFPYFTPSGSFRVAVFDRTQESSLVGIMQRFPGAYIHLVRLPLGDSFVPPLP
jgi:hypothetical protein